jgi:hypothetical protein
VDLWEPRSDRAIQESVLTFAGASAASRPSGNERRCSVNNIFGVRKAGVWRMWFAGLDYCVTDPAYTSNAYASCRLDWVKKTGKKKLVIAGLWTEVCVSLPVIDALAVGREVYMSPTRVGSCRRQARNPSSSVGNPSL